MTILITGASSGIGGACARRFAREGWRLILTGRRADRLEELAEELALEHQTESLVLVFDVRDRQETAQALETLPQEWMDIDVLVNNAGLALGLQPVQDGEVDDWETMIDTNIKGLLYVTRALSPGMVARGCGHIINIGSVAGREVYPNGAVYSATKHAVDALTKGMRMDLLRHGIKVTQIAPGAAETEFSAVRFKWDMEMAAGVYKGYEPLKGEDIAEVCHYVTTLPPHVNINDLLIMPLAQAGALVWHKR
ncbi:MAG TPA: SDR family NAD(P)-dependent oxidoreductase [Bacteroidales bacterium]|nr:SDR family NAD(P)-dependent oxidoreductase [Bacteroidales bacterium]HRZ76041.1 SDR family NAD(P)-dependent oxidoreductase [Bacteroidales bacterium]